MLWVLLPWPSLVLAQPKPNESPTKWRLPWIGGKTVDWPTTTTTTTANWSYQNPFQHSKTTTTKSMATTTPTTMIGRDNADTNTTKRMAHPAENSHRLVSRLPRQPEAATTTTMVLRAALLVVVLVVIVWVNGKIPVKTPEPFLPKNH